MGRWSTIVLQGPWEYSCGRNISLAPFRTVPLLVHGHENTFVVEARISPKHSTLSVVSRSIVRGKPRHSISAKSQRGVTRAGEGLLIFNKLTRKFVFSIHQSLPVTGTKHLQNTTRKNLFRHSCEVSDHLDRDHSEAKPLIPWRPGWEHKQPGGKTFSYEFFGGVNALVSQLSFNSITNWWPSLQHKPF